MGEPLLDKMLLFLHIKERIVKNIFLSSNIKYRKIDGGTVKLPDYVSVSQILITNP